MRRTRDLINTVELRKMLSCLYGIKKCKSRDIGRTLSSSVLGFDTMPEIIKKVFPDYEYLLYDFSPESDEEIRGRAEVVILLKMIRAIYLKDTAKLKEVLEEALGLVETLGSEEIISKYYFMVIVYVFSARKTVTLEEVAEIAEKVQRGRGDNVLTVAEQLQQEAIKKRDIEIATEMLLDKKPTDEIVKYSKLSLEEISELKNKLVH